MAGHELGERESGAGAGLGVGRGGWARGGSGWVEVVGLGVAGGGWQWLGTVRREQRVRREKTDGVKWVESSLARFGKWFTEKFSVNRFPQFTKRFSGQITNLFR